MDVVGRVADRHGVTPTAVALGWLAVQPGVASVIAGATSPEQVRTNARACMCKLRANEVEELSRITTASFGV